MPHFRVDDQLNNHPKARQAGLEAMGLWSVSGSYCMAYLTDGFVPEWYVKSWPKGTTLAKRLVTARLWTPSEHEGEKGWQFHEFTGPGRQDSRAQIEAEREKWRKKKAAQRGDTPPASPRVSPKVSPGDSPQDSRFPTQPNPKENSGYLGNAGPDSNADEPRSTPVAPDAWKLVRSTVPAEHPQAVRTELALQASNLINAGTDAGLVADALGLWLTKNVHPKTLPSLVSELINTRNRPAANGSPGPKIAASDAAFAATQALKTSPKTNGLELEA